MLEINNIIKTCMCAFKIYTLRFTLKIQKPIILPLFFTFVRNWTDV